MKSTIEAYRGWEITTLSSRDGIIYRVKDLRLRSDKHNQGDVEPIGGKKTYSSQWAAIADAKRFVDCHILRDEIMAKIDELLGDRVNGHLYFEVRRLLGHLIGL